MSDYPAAHSMDTTWFAVDANGRVAQFDSGEDGAVPMNAASGGGASEASFDTDLLESVCSETKRPIEFERDHGDEPGLYKRSSLPAEALLVSDLPEAIRDHVRSLELPVDLIAQDSVQLADHMNDKEAFLYGKNWTLRDFGPPGPPPVARVVGANKPSAIAVAVVVVIIGAILGLILR